MPRDAIEMTLTPKERSLLLRYGYPFPEIQSALQACSRSKKIETVPISRFELEQLIGNLCYSINRAKPGKLQNELWTSVTGLRPPNDTAMAGSTCSEPPQAPASSVTSQKSQTCRKDTAGLLPHGRGKRGRADIW